MKRVIAIIAVAMLAAVSSLVAADAPKAQTKCPIRGEDIDKEAYVDYAGKRIYFCCQGCDKKFLKDADANIAKMEGEGIQLDAAVCPVSGKPAKAENSVTEKGKTYFFCCDKCPTKFKANPAAYTGKPAGPDTK